jgi:hypothetical protein
MPEQSQLQWGKFEEMSANCFLLKRIIFRVDGELLEKAKAVARSQRRSLHSAFRQCVNWTVPLNRGHGLRSPLELFGHDSTKCFSPG